MKMVAAFMASSLAKWPHISNTLCIMLLLGYPGLLGYPLWLSLSSATLLPGVSHWSPCSFIVWPRVSQIRRYLMQNAVAL